MGDIYHAGNTYAGSVPIDDTQATATNTWSGQKINNEIDTKASKSIITSNDVFDPTKAYVAGDWLIHNNILYEVKAACTGITPPNATYYEVKTLHDLQGEIDVLNSELITKQDSVYEGGTYTNMAATVMVQNVCAKLLNEKDISGTYSIEFALAGSSMYMGVVYLYKPANRVFGYVLPQNFETPQGFMIFKYENGSITAKKVTYTNW